MVALDWKTVDTLMVWMQSMTMCDMMMPDHYPNWLLNVVNPIQTRTNYRDYHDRAIVLNQCLDPPAMPTVDDSKQLPYVSGVADDFEHDI